MQHSILYRAVVQLRRKAYLCLPALALALTLGTTVVLPPPAESKLPVASPPIATPLVNWNS